MTGARTGLTLDLVETFGQAKTISPLRENFARGFRRNFILRFFIVVVAVFASWGAYLALTLGRQVDGGYGAAYAALLELRRELMGSVLYSTLAQAAILVLLSSVMAIFFSHKIAGPVYRMKAYLRAWRKGEAAPGGMRLRKGDQLQRFASAVETSFSQLADSCHQIATRAETLAARIEAGEVVSTAEIDDVRSAVEKLKVS